MDTKWADAWPGPGLAGTMGRAGPCYRSWAGTWPKSMNCNGLHLPD